MKASVIIPTHNRAKLLNYCLRYISNQSVNDYEIICVDDASTDNTCEIIKNFPNVKYIKLNKHIGPYLARNIGIEKARGELIIFIDSDVIVYHKFVEDHIFIHQKHPKIILQGMVHHIKNIKTLNFNFIIPNSIFKGVFVTENASVSKHYLIEAGLFSDFGAYLGYKDFDMGIKLKKLGLKFMYAFTKCKAYHIDNPYNRDKLKEYIKKHYERGYSSYFFIKKWNTEAKKIVKPHKYSIISKLFLTNRWVENKKTLTLLEKSVDFPIVFIFPIFRTIVKSHYRVKGMKKAKIDESLCNNTHIQ